MDLGLDLGLDLGSDRGSDREGLKKKIRDYLGIFPKRRTPTPPLLGILTIFYRIFVVKLKFVKVFLGLWLK